MKRSWILTWTMLALAAPGLGCSKEKDTQQPAAETPAKSGYDALLRDYETIRAALASDEAAKVPAAAAALATSAEQALGGASAAAKPHVQGVVSASRGLEQAGASDIAKLRTAFGELSQHVVGLLAAEPSLQAGRYVFECPMVKGYRKWVQTKEAIENPYMGKEMLVCGSAAKP